ncbi:Uncharacterised protein [Vibrio cholerae]|nr:Uncharacterised protein [Vibrio cholerae]
MWPEHKKGFTLQFKPVRTLPHIPVIAKFIAIELSAK